MLLRYFSKGSSSFGETCLTLLRDAGEQPNSARPCRNESKAVFAITTCGLAHSPLLSVRCVNSGFSLSIALRYTDHRSQIAANRNMSRDVRTLILTSCGTCASQPHGRNRPAMPALLVHLEVLAAVHRGLPDLFGMFGGESLMQSVFVSSSRGPF